MYKHTAVLAAGWKNSTEKGFPQTQDASGKRMFFQCFSPVSAFFSVRNDPFFSQSGWNTEIMLLKKSEGQQCI
jgi:hypothetical protein